jgi:beta-glucanase (GH16 family)
MDRGRPVKFSVFNIELTIFLNLSGSRTSAKLLQQDLRLRTNNIGWMMNFDANNPTTSGMVMTFDDEFNSSSISSDSAATHTNWTDHIWYQTSNPGAFNVSGGVLNVTPTQPPGATGDNFLSTTNSHGDGWTQKHGYFEAAIKLPTGAGTFPSFWLINNAHIQDAAHVSPEYDVMEAQGVTDREGYWTTLHKDSSHPGDQQNYDNYVATGDLSSDFHRYGLLWDPNSPMIDFYLDGDLVRSVPKYDTSDDGPVTMILGNGMGDMIGRNYQDGSTAGHTTMQVDWVRAYQFGDHAPAPVTPAPEPTAPSSPDPSLAPAAEMDLVPTPALAAEVDPAPIPVPVLAADLAAAAPLPEPQPDPAPTPESDNHGNGTDATATDHLTIQVSGDHWNGSPLFTIKVDGQQIGETFTTTAVHDAGEWQNVTVEGSFGTGPHTVEVSFVNDACGGTHDTDRDLYVGAVEMNGQHVDGNAFASNTAAIGYDALDQHAAVMVANGTATYQVPSGTATTTGGNDAQPAPNTLVLHVSGDQGLGDGPRFAVTLDGQQIGDAVAVTASHDAGQTQDVIVDLGAIDPDKAHDIAISFLNDDFGGSHETDRNLYVHKLEINGKPVDGSAFAANDASLGYDAIDPHAAVMVTDGTATYHLDGSDYWHHA